MASLTLRPIAAGSSTTIPTQYPSSGEHWEKVDEAVADDDSTCVEGSGTDLYDLQTTGQNGVINSITLYVRTYRSSVDVLWYMVLRTHDTNYSYVRYGVVGSYTTQSQQLTTNPYTGQAWTWDEVNALEAGEQLAPGGNVERTTQVYVAVDYTPPSPQTIAPSGINQPASYGAPKLKLCIKPSGIPQSLAYGMPSIVSIGILSPRGIHIVVSCGTPALRYPQTISPAGIIQPTSIGISSIGIFGILKPQGISVIVSYDSPTILKYVWHVILDGQYVIETPDVNRAYIIGRDQYGNPVYGTAEDSAEVGLVGERLDFQQEPAIPGTAQAADVAATVLSKTRLTGKRGVIFIPPNCGQELFDVVQVTDSQANQSNVKFRVVGHRFEYYPRQAHYHHELILGAP